MKDFLQLMPEIVLALTMAFVVAGEISYYGEKTRLVSATALLGLVAAFVQTVISYQNGSSRIFSGALSIDGFSLFMKLLFIVSAGFTIASLSRAQEIAKTRRSEYCALILAATLAMCLLSSASDLILIFLIF
jgi:NADH-quinone oxidoreductase subunit N